MIIPHEGWVTVHTDSSDQVFEVLRIRKECAFETVLECPDAPCFRFVKIGDEVFLGIHLQVGMLEPPTCAVLADVRQKSVVFPLAFLVGRSQVDASTVCADELEFCEKTLRV